MIKKNVLEQEYEDMKLNSSKYRRAFPFLLILLFTVQLVLFFDIDETLKRRIIQDLHCR